MSDYTVPTPSRSMREHRANDDVPYLLDNREGSVNVRDALIRLMERSNWADIATGYFSLSGWNHLAASLEALDELRLLFGESHIARELERDLRRERFRATTKVQVERLLAFLRRDSVAVRRYGGGEKGGAFFHAKAFLVDSAAIVGSSNFTHMGLTGNTELNAVHREPPVVDEFCNWYERMWNRPEAADFKPELIGLLDRSQFGEYPYTPHEIYIKTLWEYFKDDLEQETAVDPTRSVVELANFQHEAFQKAQRILRRYHGVMVADSVGLGKTYVGKKLLELFAYYQRQRALIICPAQLREMWARQIEESRIPARILSMEALGQQDFPAARYSDIEFVLIDESHNFRNPQAQRYQTLSRILASGEPKRVVLLTATPINNSLFDLYHQINLWTRGNDSYFREAGIRSLRGYFKEAETMKGQGGALFNLLEEVVIRRTRYFIEENYEEPTINEKPLSFPERAPLQTIRYSLGDTYSGLFDRIVEIIEELELPAYNAESYLLTPNATDKLQAQSNLNILGLLKSNLLKRFESSVVAFRNSIQRLRNFQAQFWTQLQEGRLLHSGAHRRILQLEEDEEASGLDTLLESLEATDFARYKQKEISTDVSHDLTQLDEILRLIAPITPQIDSKLATFKEKLAELGNQKVVIFTYYKDTAQYLFEQLLQDGAFRDRKMAVLSSNVAPRARQRVVERFAPLSNKADSEVAQEEQLDLLIATDVLSEGQNLQDAGHLINYDLHWNPTRMIQRNGRIDRLGSPHDTIQIYNVFPDAELETLLRLVSRLQDKLQAINETIGLDASVLGEMITPRTFNTLRELAAGDDSSLVYWAQVSELASNEIMRQQLLAYLRDYGAAIVEELPDGIHSSLQRGQHKGVFAYYRHKDRHFWRLYDTRNLVMSDSRYEIHELIRATPSEPRAEDWLTVEEQERVLEQMADNILATLQEQRGAAALGESLDKVQRDLAQIIRSGWNNPTVERSQAQALFTALRNPLPPPFIKGLRTIAEQYKQDNDYALLLGRIQQLVDEYQLSNESNLTPEPEPISRDDLRLVCWMMIS